MKHTLLAAAFCVGAASSAQASTLVDFSAFSAGDVVSGAFDFGGGLTGMLTATGGIGDAVIFDTNNVTGGDFDLGSPVTNVDNAADVRNFGNVLIVQENAGAPDDAVGGTLTFVFDNPIILESIALLDVEEGTSIFDEDGQIATGGVDNSGLVNAAGDGDGPNQFIEFTFTNESLTTLTVDFAGSGAVGEFRASVVPVPAALPLLIGGLGLMGYVGRRRKKS
ncbi:MAG: VPLPA-CTERM sorting domain-containing protein [Pseudomonadota bacterium]